MLEERLVQNLPRLLVHLKMQKENSYQDNLPMIEKKSCSTILKLFQIGIFNPVV